MLNVIPLGFVFVSFLTRLIFYSQFHVSCVFVVRKKTFYPVTGELIHVFVMIAYEDLGF